MTRDQFAETLRICLVAEKAKPLISDLGEAIRTENTSQQNKIASQLSEVLADLMRDAAKRRAPPPAAHSGPAV